MEDFDKLLELKALLGKTKLDDATLLFYLEEAKDIILNYMYPFMDDEEHPVITLPNKYVRRQIRIALWMVAKRGAEGEIQHTENGVSRNYKFADVPEELLRDISPMCGVPR